MGLPREAVDPQASSPCSLSEREGVGEQFSPLGRWASALTSSSHWRTYLRASSMRGRPLRLGNLILPWELLAIGYFVALSKSEKVSHGYTALVRLKVGERL